MEGCKDLLKRQKLAGWIVGNSFTARSSLDKISFVQNHRTSPHERMFGFTRKSAGFQPKENMPDWLSEPGPVLLKNFTRSPKNDPIVQKIELVDSNPLYAWIKNENRKEQTVSTRHLAQMP